MKPMTKVYLLDEAGEKFFGEGPYRLLWEIRRSGSLRSAAAGQAMAYTKALKLLNRAEEALGYPLVIRSTGGKSGGGSTLTPEGERLMEQYEIYRQRTKEANARIFREVFGSCGCIIMASGLGTRFGGNKLMADFGGQPLICRVLDATEGLFARRVVVTRHEAVAALCKKRGISCVLHDLPGRNDTVRLGLEALGEGISGCLFCPGDQPMLRKETVEAMVETARQNPERILRLSFGDRSGAPVLFPQRFFEELKALPEGKGGSVLVKKYPEQVLAVPVRDEMELMDVDTPEDLEALRAYTV